MCPAKKTEWLSPWGAEEEEEKGKVREDGRTCGTGKPPAVQGTRQGAPGGVL